MKRIITRLAIATGTLFFVSCGDEGVDAEGSKDVLSSSSSAIFDDNAETVASYEDLPNCTSKREGQVWYVEVDDVDYKCIDHVWINLNDKSELDIVSSSSAVLNSDSDQDGHSSSSRVLATESSSSIVSGSDIELPTCSPSDIYDDSKYYCDDGLLYNKCGSSIYDPRKKFCDTLTNLTYELCGGQSYNVNTKFCLEGTIAVKCDGKIYTENQFCYKEKFIFDKCDGKEYDLSEKYCYADAISIKAGKITDLRDDMEYGTVTIGSQTWMAENLNYAAEGSKCYEGESSNCLLFGRLYPWNVAMGLPSSCKNTSCEGQIESKHKGVCPTGWHMPSQTEWTTLKNYVESLDEIPDNAGQWLKNNHVWKKRTGVDGVGFSAFPAGSAYESYMNVYYSYLGTGAFFWSATENALIYGVDCGCTYEPVDENACSFCTEARNTGAFAVGLENDWSFMNTETDVPDPWNGSDRRTVYEKTTYMSVRCVKD